MTGYNQSTGASDPFEFVRNLWSGAGFPLPGMVTPTLDADELGKRISEMRSVENWLRMNLNMLQMTIQGLEMQQATLNAVRAMNPAAASHEAQLLSDRFRTEQPSIDLVRVTLSEIMFRLTDIVSEFGGDPDEALHSSGYHDRLYFSFHNIYELTRYLDETVQRLCEYLNRLVKKDGQIRVSDIVSYINNNYVESITVKKLSEMFYISPVYLGRLFSAKMGTSLNSYVNSVRIRNAQTLLQTTDLKVYAICNNVGYKSIKYFYKVFKDEVGMTPHEYRLIHGMR